MPNLTAFGHKQGNIVTDQPFSVLGTQLIYIAYSIYRVKIKMESGGVSMFEKDFVRKPCR